MYPEKVRVALLAVGTELTDGAVQDVHARYIGAILKSTGYQLEKILLIPDSKDLFLASLHEFSVSSDVVVVTGGLGPTSDDLTREVVAETAGVPLIFSEELWTDIQSRFSGVEDAASNRLQAFIPEGFTPLRNPNGTAPGFYGAAGCSLLIALPGPPRELNPMFDSQVVPLLKERFSADRKADLEGTAFLLREARLEDLLKECRVGSVTWSTCAAGPRISFTLRGGNTSEREEIFRNLQQRAGSLVIRRGDARVEELVFNELKERSFTIVTAESCTGGMVSSLLTAVPGSSEVVWGGFTTYANSAKTDVLGVGREVIERFGAVSEETALEMCRGAIRLSGADIALAVSGIAGPSGGTPEKPVGTVCFGVCRKDGRELAVRFHFTGSRDAVRRKATVCALLLTESMILEKESLDSVLNSEYI